MSTPSWAVAERNLELSGVITLTSGAQISLTQSDISSYSINDSTATSGFNIGGTCSASFRLSFYNPGKTYTPSQFDNAEVHMRVRVNEGEWQHFGVWYVESADCPEQSVLINLSGADALKSRFEAKFIDKGAYPQTFYQILTTVSVLALGGAAPARNDFPNAALRKTAKPKWPEDCTLRQVVGYIAACAGGFAHMTRDGRLDIISYIEGSTWDLTPAFYQTYNSTGGESFKFNCLQVKLGNSDEYTRFVVDRTIEDSPTNCIQIEGNPIITELVANNLVPELGRLPAYEAGSLTWGGDPAILPGDTIRLTDLNGNAHIMRVMNQSYTFNGGMSCSESCDLPSVTEVGDSYTTGGRVFDSNGNLKATHISGLGSSVVNATYGHFSSLTADTVQTDTLLASIIQAITLKAQQISATDITTDNLTAMTAEIISATIRKLTAETIKTDELYAALADITALKVESLTADSITTDKLAAALAAFTVVTAGTANFDKATVKHLIASALNVEEAVGGKVTISNLAVDYASIVSAYVGNLVIKASDGSYYRLDISENGEISPVPIEVSEAEEINGQMSNGAPIIESDMVVSDLSATDIRSTYALINRIDAARIDVDTLSARQAFINVLQTADLVSNTTLNAYLVNHDTEIDDLGAWRDSISRWIRFNEDGLTQGKEGSIYSTLIDEKGFHIRKEGSVDYVGSFDTGGLTTDGIRMGIIKAKKTSRGGWAWQEVTE